MKSFVDKKMKYFIRFMFFFLSVCFLFGIAPVCYSEDVSDIFESLSETDKQVYVESDTVRLSISVKNISSGENVLKARGDNDFRAGVYIRNARVFHLEPEDAGAGDIVVRPGETRVFRYEFPAYRAVLYAEYVEELMVNIQGPWLENISLTSTDLTISTSYREAPVPDAPVVNECFSGEGIFAMASGGGVVGASEEDRAYLSDIPEAVEFAERVGHFDALIFDHRYKVSVGPGYFERVAVLCSRGHDIEALVIRTWPDGRRGAELSRILSSYELRYPEEKEDAGKRFKIIFEPATDFGYIRVYDERGDKILFSATSVFMGTGTMLLPHKLEVEEIRELSDELSKRDAKFSRVIGFSYEADLDEVEKMLFKMGMRILNISDNYCMALIPQGDERNEYIGLLKKENIVKKID